MNGIALNAHAKLNLSLEILSRRADGYHDIRSLMQGIGIHDVIKLTTCAENETKCNFTDCTICGIVVYLCTDAKTIPADMSNLALKGVKALLEAYEADYGAGSAAAGNISDGLVVSIEKHLPVAAGIAGGSGNGAAAMLGLNAMLDCPYSLRDLMRIGVKVGADVPFSLLMNAAYNRGRLAGMAGLDEASAAAWVTGIGDIVNPADPLRFSVIMAKPEMPVSTKAAYEAIDRILAENGTRRRETSPAGEAACEGAAAGPLFINDLEEYTLTEYPEVAEMKCVMQKKLNADHVMMSGSGPSLAAYFEDDAAADSALHIMGELCRSAGAWRVWRTETGY